MTPRRRFLFDCSAAAAGLALSPLTSAGLPAVLRGSSRSLEQMSYSELARQVNTRFRVRLSPSRSVEIKLVRAPLAPPVRPGPGGRLPPDAGNERFSLIFSGPTKALLDSVIHQFEHAELGRFEMFIGLIGPRDADPVHYEAVFNRPPPRGSACPTLT
ncbi:exported hypothetical protein [Verrucomicrobia bacterium]|nr:exported hypothetical protein [Verrucomicrobiota bacterium]